MATKKVQITTPKMTMVGSDSPKAKKAGSLTPPLKLAKSKEMTPSKNSGKTSTAKAVKAQSKLAKPFSKGFTGAKRGK